MYSFYGRLITVKRDLTRGEKCPSLFRGFSVTPIEHVTGMIAPRRKDVRSDKNSIVRRLVIRSQEIKRRAIKRFVFEFFRPPPGTRDGDRVVHSSSSSFSPVVHSSPARSRATVVISTERGPCHARQRGFIHINDPIIIALARNGQLRIIKSKGNLAKKTRGLYKSGEKLLFLQCFKIKLAVKSRKTRSEKS